jgi:signal transduction histidine kinase
MAEDAHAINTADFSQRLALPGTRDEIENVALAFNDLLDRLQEAFEREQRFTGDAAHQLRTPVTVLLGQIEVARRRTRSVEEYQRTLDVLQQQTVALRELIESLLFLARAGKDAEAPHLEQVDLRSWLPTQLESWSHHARAADLQLVGAEGGPLPARISPTLFSQLVHNFVDNGLKYSQSGSLVTVSLEQVGERAVLAVTDQGMGLTAEEVSHVFDPFYRSPASRQAGISGTGLGLAIAARIAEVLGLELRVTSQKGGGSRFEIHVPLVGYSARDFSGVAAAGRT